MSLTALHENCRAIISLNMGFFDFFPKSSIGGAGLGLISSGLGQLFNRRNMRKQQQYVQENMRLSNELNKDFAGFTWRNEIPQNVAAMKQAGLNPAGASTSLAGAGNVGNALASTFPTGSNYAPDLLSGVSALAESNLLASQQKGQDIKNESDLIDLQNKKEFNKELSQPQETYYANPETGERLSETELADWRDKHSKHLVDWMPELVVIPSQSKGKMDAQKYRLDNLAGMSEARAKDSLSKLEKKISDKKFDSKPYIDAVVNLPETERDRILAEIKNIGLDNYYKNFINEQILPLQLESLETNVNELKAGSLTNAIAQIKDDSLGFGEKLGVILLYLIKQFGGTTSINFGASASKVIK